MNNTTQTDFADTRDLGRLLGALADLDTDAQAAGVVVVVNASAWAELLTVANEIAGGGYGPAVEESRR